MDLFPDGIHVRLRNRVHGTYLYAEDDGAGVSLRPRGHGAAAGGVWRVHRVVRDGIDYVLLHGAAYGRYLALSPQEAAPPGCVGRGAVQRGYDQPDLDAVMWRPVAVPGCPGYVLLRHVLNRNLRANGRFKFWNNAAVSLDNYVGTRSTMRHWLVEVVAPRQDRPPLPIFVRKEERVGGLRWWRTAPEVDRMRTIRFLRSEEPLNFGPNNVASFSFYGRSVFNLRTQLGIRANQGNVYDTIVCVQAGLHGRLTPLATDLHRSVAPMNIVVFSAALPDAAELVYPDVDA